MEIKQEQLPGSLLQVKVEVAPEDYQKQVEDAIKNTRKRIQMPGFRTGQVPKSVIEKKHGREIRYNAIMEQATSQLSKYIGENQIRRMGTTDVSAIEPEDDFSAPAKAYTITFLVGVAPKFNFEVSEQLTLPWKNITVEEEDVEERYKQFRASAVEPVDVEQSTHERAIFYGKIEGVDAAGVSLEKENAMLIADYIKDEATKKAFQTSQKGGIVSFVPAVAFDNNEAEIVSLLGIDKSSIDQVKEVTLQFSIERITEPRERALSKELFAEVFGAGQEGETEEDFRNAIRQRIQEGNDEASFSLFIGEVYKYLAEHFADVELPDHSLKLMLNEKHLPEEEFVPMYEAQRPTLIAQIALQELAEKAQIEVTNEDLKQYYKDMYRGYFGGASGEQVESILERLAEDQIKKGDDAQARIRIFDNKVCRYIKENVTLDITNITKEEAQAIFRELNGGNVEAQEEEEVSTYAEEDAKVQE